MSKNKDIFGEAAKAYYFNEDQTPITVKSPDFDDDTIPVAYLFRDYAEMPVLEQAALEMCEGTVLDVGCSVGSHSLYLQKKGLEVTGIDISEASVEIAKKRGFSQAQVQDFYKMENGRFDTLLFLMNGSGIIGRTENLPKFFQQCRKLLTENGKILMDSSDLIFLFDEEPEIFEEYYGEMQFQISWKDHSSEAFDWLYIDPETLKKAAEDNNFHCTIVKEGEHYDYLAELRPL